MTTQKASVTVLGMGNQYRQLPTPTREVGFILAAFSDTDAIVAAYDRADGGLPAAKLARVTTYPGKQGWSPRERKALVQAAMAAKLAARKGGSEADADAATVLATEHATGAAGVATATAVTDRYTITSFELARTQGRTAALAGHPHHLPHLCLLAARLTSAQAAVAHIPATA